MYIYPNSLSMNKYFEQSFVFIEFKVKYNNHIFVRNKNQIQIKYKSNTKLYLKVNPL